jgi:lysozyme family protein
MLGLTRNAAGKVGLMVFFNPRTLQRGANVAVNLKVNGKPLAPLTGIAPSDFHVSVDGPVGRATLAALRQAKAIEATAESKTVQFQVEDLGAVLDELDACVKSNTIRIEPDAGQHQPDAPQPDSAQPDSPQPDTPQPDMPAPDTSQPDVRQNAPNAQ